MVAFNAGATTKRGELGVGKGVSAMSIPNLSISLLAMGGYHACALTDAGTIKCWGENEVGQMGDGAPLTGTSDYDRFTPITVTNVP